MFDYKEVFDRFGIRPRGVLHIGAFEGHEDQGYLEMGFQHRLYVEAQPETYARLVKNLQGRGAACENLAVSDRAGTAEFFPASNGQSSSLLRLDRHSKIYPAITQSDPIQVRTMRVDDLLAREEYSGIDFNFMNVDIQGAELLCLMGACASLAKFDILNLEVNFDQLYTGAPHISQLDSFLAAFDFVRADTKLAHASWGDALYVRNAFTKVA